MKELLKIRDLLFGDSGEEYFIETRNKKNGWIGVASFHTNGEEKIHVNEGDPSGSDDASYSYKDFLKKYDYELKKEEKISKPNNYFNMFTLLGRINSVNYDENKKLHVICIKSSNIYGDFVIPINAYGKLEDNVLKLLKYDALIGIKGFIGLTIDGIPELHAQKFTILASKSDDENEN